jgi:hypothetical protein
MDTLGTFKKAEIMRQSERVVNTHRPSALARHACQEPGSRTLQAKKIATILETRLLNEREVSKILGTPMGTLRRWRCAGEGPIFIKLGSGPKAAVRYHPLDIDRFVDEGRRFSIRAGSAGGEKQWP